MKENDKTKHENYIKKYTWKLCNDFYLINTMLRTNLVQIKLVTVWGNFSWEKWEEGIPILFYVHMIFQLDLNIYPAIFCIRLIKHRLRISCIIAASYAYDVWVIYVESVQRNIPISVIG